MTAAAPGVEVVERIDSLPLVGRVREGDLIL